MVASGVAAHYLRLETHPLPALQQQAAQESSHCSYCMWRLINCFKATGPDSSLQDAPSAVHEHLGQYRAPVVAPPSRASSGVSLISESECDEDHCHGALLLPKRPTGKQVISTAGASSSTDASSQELRRLLHNGSTASSGRAWLPSDAGPLPRPCSSSKLVVVGGALVGQLPLAGSGVGLVELQAVGMGTTLMAGDDYDDEDCCPTCLDVYTEDNPRIWTRCGHHFHMQCIYEWLERKETCPMCESHVDFDGMT